MSEENEKFIIDFLAKIQANELDENLYFSGPLEKTEEKEFELADTLVF